MCSTLHRYAAIFKVNVPLHNLRDAHGIVESLSNLPNDFHLGITKPLLKSDAILLF